MKTIGNLIWLVLNGLWLALGWLLAACGSEEVAPPAAQIAPPVMVETVLVRDIVDRIESAIHELYPDAQLIIHQEPAGIADARLDHRLKP